MNDERMRELFAEMREEAPPADSLARVRLAVADRTVAPATGSVWWRRFWPAWAAAAGLAAVVCWMIWAPGGTPVVEPVRTVAAPPAAETPRPLPFEGGERAVEQPPMRVVSGSKPAPAAARPKRATAPAGTENVVIRIETEDPDVVILLIGE